MADTEENKSSWDLGSFSGGSNDADSTTDSSESNSDQENTKQEIPIVDQEEAIKFGMKELGKIMRDDGHQIELKVIGNIDYRVGAWIRTFIPSFGEDGMFFISKAQQEASAESEWITSLTLVDYPPSLSKGESNTTNGDASSTGDGSGDGTGDGESGDGSGSSSSGCSSKLWTELSKVAWKYYPKLQNKDDKFIRPLCKADSNWTSVAKIINGIGNPENKKYDQNDVIREVLAKKMNNGSDSSKVTQSSAQTNSHHQRNQVTYNKNNSQYYIKNYLNNK